MMCSCIIINAYWRRRYIGVLKVDFFTTTPSFINARRSCQDLQSGSSHRRPCSRVSTSMYWQWVRCVSPSNSGDSAPIYRHLSSCWAWSMRSTAAHNAIVYLQHTILPQATVRFIMFVHYKTVQLPDNLKRQKVWISCIIMVFSFFC